MSYSRQQGRSEGNCRLSSGRGAVFVVCIGLMACSPLKESSAQLGYSQAPGTIDETPTSAFGDLSQDFPPKPDGSPWDSTEGKGVQAFSVSLIGRR